MMTIRIDKIKVNRGGPLNGDFELDPANLNLIYGQNETGKTYVVEAMVSLLFRTTGRQAPVKWNLRGWDLAGRIVVSGLDDDPVEFTKTSSKLEDYWEESRQGLPQDLSRLLVVRAGDTSLSDEAKGIGRNILRDYLSGEAVLDKIRDRISPTIQKASLEHRSIQGDNRGEIKSYRGVREKLEQLDNLLNEVNRGYTAGAIHSLRRNIAQKEAELAGLLKAKRHHAATRDNNLQTLNNEMTELPGEDEYAQIQTKIGVYNEKKINRDRLEEELKPLEASIDNYTWIERALTNYKEILNRQQIQKPNPIFLILAAISFAGAVISGFMDQKWGLGISALVTLAFFWLHMSRRMNFQASVAGDSAELEKLKTAFQNRFGKKLTDMAAIQSRLEALKKDHFRTEQLHEDMSKLYQEIISVEGEVTSALQVYTDKELTPDNWKKEVQSLKKRRISMESNIRDIEKEIASLGIPQYQYLDDDPGVKWNSDRYTALEKEINQDRDTLEAEERDLGSLKSRVAQETNKNGTENWGDLLTALQDKREQAAAEYKEITAEVLGKIHVFTALEEFREQETERIKKGLSQLTLVDPLFTITGRYNRIDLEDDDLILSDRDDHSFALANMSTGAREQVFLALRLGFASISMKGEAAFLILDDAFQHSDWHRRKNLLDQTFNLV
ncbi:MAG: AAA family ATPase, partial [Candidatus Hydrothermarchaeaceae archaeon]